ncbi:Adenosine monophosphate-protein transferase VbhT [Pelotomaculum schinkii]|uniref:protein adenylyltransferase n=1 Tax=Pelotomaculum schinkii TaxID=78350 RepID=A0A4Y7RG55_9FIRM|nr:MULTISPECIES: Fic family protein [Pelotomaculum]TEB07761.1 Adenosine monophosphate-protein transferase VbhT [Pelotomaculum schinkii]TEB16059.1 Adenosine monophosphate-protein transferase VbhT [Pelotomaculum sp. FP]
MRSPSAYPFISEINMLHPFREGNGRVQRLFIQYLAENAGYQVDFSQVTDKEMIEASAEAFACHYGKMDALFQRITTPL